jgi:hypothetical protein
VTGILRPYNLAWGALWFAVVVLFTAGVGVIQATGDAGEMPPLSPTIEAVIGNENPSRSEPLLGNEVDEPSSGPTPPTVVDVGRAG